ncbi:MAG: hypothetical protein ACRC46_07320 [Thermoguttaceae bacterium]
MLFVFTKARYAQATKMMTYTNEQESLDPVRCRFAEIRKTDAVCIALALFVLAMSVPFYAFNRSAENVASFHCQSFFRYVSASIAAGFAENMLRLKQIAFLDEGFPSGIWCFSWTLILLTIWRDSRHSQAEQVFWCFFPVVLNTSWEIFQAAGIIDGSGNTPDCIFGFLGGSLALMTHESIQFYRKALP